MPPSLIPFFNFKTNGQPSTFTVVGTPDGGYNDWIEYDDGTGTAQHPIVNGINSFTAVAGSVVVTNISGNNITSLTFSSDTYTEITYEGFQLTSFDFLCANLTILTSFIFTSAAKPETITSFKSAWYQCSSLTSFPLIDTSSGTDFVNAWGSCSGLTSFPLIDTSAATTLYGAWVSCSGLTSFPLIDTSGVTDFNSAWSDCSSLTSFPLIDTSSGTDFGGTWNSCANLTAFPLIDTSIGTDFESTWNSCSSLTSFPLIDTSSGTNFFKTWNSCTSLTSFPAINTANGTVFGSSTKNGGTWRNCTSLQCIGAVDTTNATVTTDMFLETSLQRPAPGLQTKISNGFDYHKEHKCPANIFKGDSVQNIHLGVEDVSKVFVGNTNTYDFERYYSPAKFRVTVYASLRNQAVPTLSTSSGSYTLQPEEVYDNGNGSWTINTLAEITSVSWYNKSPKTIDIIIADNLTSAYQICRGNTSLTSFKSIPLPLVTTLKFAFYTCSSLTDLDVSGFTGVTSLEQAFRGCDILQSFDATPFTNVTNIYGAWRDCYTLTTFDTTPLTSATAASYAWDGCTGLSSFNTAGLISVKTAVASWMGCENLSVFDGSPLISLIDISSAWRDCTKLTKFDTTAFTSVTNANFSWYGCNRLVHFDSSGLVSIVELKQAWYICTQLYCMTALNTTSITENNRTQLFAGCNSLQQPDTAAVTDLTDTNGANWANPNTCSDFEEITEKIIKFEYIEGPGHTPTNGYTSTIGTIKPNNIYSTKTLESFIYIRGDVNVVYVRFNGLKLNNADNITVSIDGGTEYTVAWNTTETRYETVASNIGTPFVDELNTALSVEKPMTIKSV